MIYHQSVLTLGLHGMVAPRSTGPPGLPLMCRDQIGFLLGT